MTQLNFETDGFDVQKKTFRRLFYFGALSIIVITSLATSYFSSQILSAEFNNKIEQLSSSLIEEKKRFLRNAVERTFVYIEHEITVVKQMYAPQNLSDTQIEAIAVKRIGDYIRNLRLIDDGYIWVNHVINYDGGDNYAIRKIHPNLPDSEGEWLSTNATDIKGNRPYETELNGVKRDGQVYFEYYFKRLNSDEISHKMSFAKLYKPYDWIIATGVYLDDVDALIAKEQKIMRVTLKKKQLLIYLISALIFVLGGAAMVVFEVNVHNLVENYQMRLQERTRELSASEEKYRALFESSSVGIALCRMDGTLQDVNQGFLDIIQYDRDEALNLTYWELTPKDYADQEQIQLQSLQTQGWYGPYEKHYIRKDGTWVSVLLNGSLIHDPEGVPYIWSVVQDISERKNAENAIQNALDAATLASQAKSEFLANMSHELRTPLNSIIGFSEMMEYEIKGPLPETYHEYSKLITTSGRLLLDTVNSILDLAKIEAGKLELDLNDVSIASVVEEAITLLRALAHDKGIEIKNQTHDMHTLHVDALRIQQLFMNIIGNAIKFTEQGTIRIFNQCDDTGHHISVADTGIGMTNEQIVLALEPFQQVHGHSFARRYQGTGLGLSLCQRIMELHGGKLTIQSEAHVGTTITLSFPNVAERKRRNS